MALIVSTGDRESDNRARPYLHKLYFAKKAFKGIDDVCFGIRVRHPW